MLNCFGFGIDFYLCKFSFFFIKCVSICIKSMYSICNNTYIFEYRNILFKYIYAHMLLRN